MKNGSLRLRLLLAAAFAITIALFLAGLALATLFEQQVRARVMQELNNDLLQLAGSIEVVPTGEVKVTRPLADPRFETPYGDKYWSIARVPANDSKPLLRSRSFWDSEPALRSVGPEGEPLISVERTITIGSGGKDVSLHLVVSTHAAEIASPLSRFRNQLILYLLLIGMALTIAAWFQVAIGLRPLQTLRDQLPELGGSHTKRLSGEFPNEVQPLVSELNEVLDLRDKSLARARHRAGDLAHGLMTPLTILTAISRQLEEKGLTHYGNEINEQIEKMRGHVERGLVRARLSTGRGYELTPLAENVDAVIATLRKLPKGAEIQWHNNVPSEALVPLERVIFWNCWAIFWIMPANMPIRPCRPDFSIIPSPSKMMVPGLKPKTLQRSDSADEDLTKAARVLAWDWGLWRISQTFMNWK